MSHSRSLALVCAALAASVLVPVGRAAPAMGGGVWVVDDDGGAGSDATSLQQAADAALDGDTLLVMPGTYGSLEVDGKSLTIVADGTGPVQLAQAQLWIHDVGPGKRVVARGLQVVGGVVGTTLQRVPLRLASNQGHVWLEDCTFTNTDALSPGNPALPGVPGASVANSTAVTLVRCTLRGTKNNYSSSPFSWTLAGILSESSSLVIHDSQLEGADGSGGPSCFGACPGMQAGPGLALDKGFGFVTNSTLSGGQGLQGGPGTTLLNCGQGGHGGHGVVTLGTGPGSLTLIGTTLVPGLGGPGGKHPDGFTCNSGVDGAPLVDYAGIHPTIQPAPAPRAQVDATTTELALANLLVTGQPGDFAFLFIGGAPNMNPLLSLSSVISVAPPQFPLATAFLDGSGETTFSLQAPPLPGLPGAEAVTFFLQLAHVTPDLQLMLGGPTAWTVLDSGF